MSILGETGVKPVDPASIPQRRLPTGAAMPAIGLGTFGSDSVGPAEVAAAVRGAAAIGYRHFDCASVYGNEDAVGAALEDVMRERRQARGALDHVEALERQARARRRHRVLREVARRPASSTISTCYLVHWPFPNFHPPGCDVSSRSPHAKPYIHENYMRTWREMEELVDRGLVRHIGTSNMTIPKMKLVLRDARIKPAVNEMELHPHFQQPELFRFVVDNGIQPIGYCPLGSPGRPERDRTPDDTSPMEDPVIVAIAERHGVHPAAVCIKWAVQRGQTPIPFSVNPRNYAANLCAAAEDPLTEEEMERDRRDRPQLPLDQGPGFPLEGRPDLGRSLGRQRRDHPAVSTHAMGPRSPSVPRSRRALVRRPAPSGA